MVREEVTNALKDLLINYFNEVGEVNFSELKGKQVAVIEHLGKSLIINIDTMIDTLEQEHKSTPYRVGTEIAILELRLFQIVDRWTSGFLAPSVYLTF